MSTEPEKVPGVLDCFECKVVLDKNYLICDLGNLQGKTITQAKKWKSHDGIIKLLRIIFTDATYCDIVAGDPRIDINLRADGEEIILTEHQLLLIGKEGK